MSSRLVSRPLFLHDLGRRNLRLVPLSPRLRPRRRYTRRPGECNACGHASLVLPLTRRAPERDGRSCYCLCSTVSGHTLEYRRAASMKLLFKAFKRVKLYRKGCNMFNESKKTFGGLHAKSFVVASRATELKIMFLDLGLT